ncbi:DUF4212 domain-containing protein [Ramlibacter tataouinensis]|uniref:Sodium symporter small subunit domain-containing protein n=1 Tax=Ramlibacter tataouinensis (strain ATCC BAA-407 / DSM 14655 / LMG 21543 / TTB310) TaxID=365046 RepID=F5Y1B3_RAMTT|nr:sodium/substrate symporter small subunit [Ramlibacter tataouinensis]AEG93514.1 Conserved hypothetical protein [Ramlibacter tataouinensis TTB310]
MSSSSRPRTSRLAVLRAGLLLAWAIASFGVCFFARELQFTLGDWPFSYWMMAQGAIIVFTLVLAVDAWAVNRSEAGTGEADPEAGTGHG